MMKRRMKFQVTNTTRRIKKNIPETGHSAAVTSEHTQQQTEKDEAIINGVPNDVERCGKSAPEKHLESDRPEIDFVASHNAEHLESNRPEIEFVASHNAECVESLWTKLQPVTVDTCTEVNDHEPEFVVNIQPAVESMSDDTNFENIDLNSEFLVSIQQKNELITVDISMEDDDDTSMEDDDNTSMEDDDDTSMEHNLDSPQCVPSDVPEDEVTKDYCPCPVLIIGPDGEVMIDEKSLYIPRTVTEECKGKVIEKRKPPRWTKSDTTLFYRALECVGINFEAMAGIMKKFTRTEIKAKFKKESRMNPDAIQKIIKEAHETKLQLVQS